MQSNPPLPEVFDIPQVVAASDFVLQLPRPRSLPPITDEALDGSSSLPRCRGTSLSR